MIVEKIVWNLQKKLPEPISQFNKILDFKINSHKSVVFLYTSSNLKLKFKNRESIKNMKCLYIYMSKDM